MKPTSMYLEKLVYNRNHIDKTLQLGLEASLLISLVNIKRVVPRSCSACIHVKIIEKHWNMRSILSLSAFSPYMHMQACMHMDVKDWCESLDCSLLFDIGKRQSKYEKLHKTNGKICMLKCNGATLPPKVKM